MKDIEYGHIELRLKEIMKAQNISINKLACRAEMQLTQLKNYMNNNIQRVDLAILSRLCYCLECDLSDLLVYVKAEADK